VKAVPQVIAHDPDDDHVLAVAVANWAEKIITGDKRHLLNLGSHNSIDIIAAREACERLGLA
jgi:uncharacterized protein